MQAGARSYDSHVCFMFTLLATVWYIILYTTNPITNYEPEFLLSAINLVTYSYIYMYNPVIDLLNLDIYHWEYIDPVINLLINTWIQSYIVRSSITNSDIWRFPKPPVLIQTVDHFSIETHGNLGIHQFKKAPYSL